MSLPQVPNMPPDPEDALKVLYDYLGRLHAALNGDPTDARTKVGLVGAGATRDALDAILKLL